jgi:hypothetical protein
MIRLIAFLLLFTTTAQATEEIIGGIPFDPKLRPQFVIAGCSATVVGPRAVISSAHCQASGSRRTLKDAWGRTYQLTYYSHPYYTGQTAAFDIALGIVDVPITGIKPFRVAGGLTGGWHRYFGHGCTIPGGPWGLMTFGTGYTTRYLDRNATIESRGPIVCGGDSGGQYTDVNVTQLEGVISRGGVTALSYHANLALAAVHTWIAQVALPRGVQVCGVTGGGCEAAQ